MLQIIGLVAICGGGNDHCKLDYMNLHIRSYCRILLILPELALNVFGTIWAFCSLIKCTADEQFTKTVVEGKTINDQRQEVSFNSQMRMRFITDLSKILCLGQLLHLVRDADSRLLVGQRLKVGHLSAAGMQVYVKGVKWCWGTFNCAVHVQQYSHYSPDIK